MKGILKINDFIIRGRRAGQIKSLLSEFIHLVNENNQIEELVRATGQELPEELAKNQQLFKIISKNPALKEAAIEVNKLQASLEKVEDEVEREQIQEKIDQYNLRLLDVFMSYETEYDNELELKKNNIKFDIMDIFFASKEITHMTPDDLSLAEVDNIILEIAKEPENGYDQSNFLSIQGSVSQLKITTQSIEPLEQTSLVDTTEKSLPLMD